MKKIYIIILLLLLPLICIGQTKKSFTINKKNYLATIPSAKTINRGKLKVYKYTEKNKLIKITDKKIASNKNKFKISVKSNRITLKRKSDNTIYRIFTFKPKKKKLIRYIKKKNINIGLGELSSLWGASYEAVIPSNRSSWAMAMAMSRELMLQRNIDFSINDIFATTLKEAKMGCDINAQGIEFQEETFSDGCFQFQGPGDYTAWSEMQKIYPTRLGNQDYYNLVPGDKFETSAVLLAYYFNFSKGMFDHRGWDIDQFIKQASDANANSIVYSLAYNRGLWADDVYNILETNRDFCMAQQDLIQCISDSEGNDYAQNVSAHGKSLASFADNYNEQISWNEIKYFIERIEILYPETDFKKLKKRTKNIFNNLENNGRINFQTDFYSILHTILDNLPEFENSSEKIQEFY